MSWFDDLLNIQIWKDGIALPRRQVVNVTIPDSADSGGSLVDNPGQDRSDLTLPRFRPHWLWFLSHAPAVNAVRYIRPYRDIYDTSFAVSRALPVPKAFQPRYFGWHAAGFALSDAITFTIVKNGVDTGVVLNIPAGAPPGIGNIFTSALSVSFAKGDSLGVKVLQAGTAVQNSWHAQLTLGG